MVGDQPAFCTGLACDFDYVAGSSVIEGFSIDSSFVLNIQGQNLGTPLEVSIGLMQCTNIVSTSSEINCELPGALPAG